MKSPGRKRLLIGLGRLNLVHVGPDVWTYSRVFVISEGETNRAVIRCVSWRIVAMIEVTKSWLEISRPGKTRRMVSVSSFTGGGDGGITVDDSWVWNCVVCCLRSLVVIVWGVAVLCPRFRIARMIFIFRFVRFLYPFLSVDF
jgi:hypothetical protein